MADYTEADLDAIRKAIKSGVRTVQFGDRSTTYASMRELLEAEARITAALEGPAKQRTVVVDRGF